MCAQAGLSGMQSCCLKDGQPVAASNGLSAGAAGHCVGHYMVLVGIDGDDTNDTNGNVYMSDPYAGSAGAASYMAYTKQNFINSWSRYGNQYVVIKATPPVSIVANSTNIPPAQVNVTFAATVSAQFGNPPYQFSATNLPLGLAMSSSGTISGIPTTSGTFQSTLQVTDSTPSFAQAPVAITVGASPLALTITAPGNLDAVKVGSPITSPVELTAAGGAPPYHWSANGLICPTSISGLDGICVSDSGTVQGTPTTSTNSPVSFNLQVTDSSATPQKANKTVNLAVLPTNLPPQVYSVTPYPSTVREGGTSTLTCTAVDPQQLSMSYGWSVTGGAVSGSGASVTWTAPSAPGGYTATCKVTSSANLSASNSVVIQVSNAALNSSVSPTSGTFGVTQFTVNGSGASAGGGVTATITLPNSSTTTSHTTANSSGQYSFGPFTESLVGVYSEIDSDDKTSNKSLPFTWTVSPVGPTVTGVSPSPVPALNGTQQLLINGNTFQSGATVTYHDPRATPTPTTARPS